MGRPRQYDPEAVLDAAQAAFWSRGYSATSVAHLCEATGLKKGSLYQAFGDKHALFMTVLERYLEHGRAALARLADTPGEVVLDTLAEWLSHSTASACLASGPGGCMAVNLRMELAPHDPAVRDRLEAHFDNVRQTIADALARGQQAGVVRGDQPPETLANYLNTLVAGLSIAGRVGEANASPGMIALAIDAVRAAR